VFPIYWFVLLFSGIGFLGFGAAYMLWPSRMAALTDLALPTASARADFAATYGGLQLGFGVFLLACTRVTAWVEPGLWAAAAALGGIAGVRVLAILLSGGRVRSTIYAGLGLELLGLVLNVWARGRIR
jgi:hypothetical protein